MKERYTLKDDGFCAVWYEGNKYRDKVVIYMSGAKCDEKMTIESSKYIREAGYSVLCLGFYLWDGMPKEMYKIPVEYVERAVVELKDNGYRNIAIHGVSTGAGYALLCASFISDISCTIAAVPYDYVMEGMRNDLFPLGFAVYSYHGESLPFSHYTCMNEGLIKALKGFFRVKKQGGYRLAHMNRYGYDTSEENEESRIKVENMKSDVLLMAPTYDHCWPSEQSVPRMERILKDNNYPYRVKTIMYENASHAMAMDMGDLKNNAVLRFLIGIMLPTEKMYPEACEKAREDSKQQILIFLEEWECSSHTK